jgi:hypothetical protein
MRDSTKAALERLLTAAAHPQRLGDRAGAEQLKKQQAADALLVARHYIDRLETFFDDVHAIATRGR